MVVMFVGISLCSPDYSKVFFIDFTEMFRRYASSSKPICEFCLNVHYLYQIKITAVLRMMANSDSISHWYSDSVLWRHFSGHGVLQFLFSVPAEGVSQIYSCSGDEAVNHFTSRIKFADCAVI